MSLLAIDYKRGSLKILNQLLLPEQAVYEKITSVEDGWQAIRTMKVRGAPSIAIVGALSVAVELASKDFDTPRDLVCFVTSKLEYLKTARPTAVNIAEAANRLTIFVKQHAEQTNDASEIKIKLLHEIESMLEKDISDNKAIGRFGAEDILKSVGENSVKLLTHCNTGSLATAGYGTALGIIRALHDSNKLGHVFCTETRPYNQGSRLTAYELVYEKIPATLIADSMASMAMKNKGVSAVVVGADRVVANGDTANKIGTYQLAITAKYHKVPFYVAAPTTSIDLSLANGSAIVIEERPPDELTLIKGMRIAAPGICCWNPAFDVTPAELITGGIITEKGVFKPAELAKKIHEK